MNATIHDPVPADSKQRDILTPEKLDSIIEKAARCAQDPLFDDWVAAVEEYRRLNNTVPDAA